MRNIGYVLLALGLIAAVVALLGDAIGLGGHDGFGSRQLALLVVGIVVALVGGFLSFRSLSAAS